MNISSHRICNICLRHENNSYDENPLTVFANKEFKHKASLFPNTFSGLIITEELVTQSCVIATADVKVNYVSSLNNFPKSNYTLF